MFMKGVQVCSMSAVCASVSQRFIFTLHDFTQKALRPLPIFTAEQEVVSCRLSLEEE